MEKLYTIQYLNQSGYRKYLNRLEKCTENIVRCMNFLWKVNLDFSVHECLSAKMYDDLRRHPSNMGLMFQLKYRVFGNSFFDKSKLKNAMKK